MNNHSKVSWVIQRLREGPLSSWQAITERGVTRLAAIIFDLRQRGYQIESKDIQMPPDYRGRYPVQYILLGEPTQK